MAGTLNDLSKQMKNLAAGLPIRANALKQNVARTINFDLLQSTPVDTGLAMSNWQVNLDSPATEPREAFVPSAEGYMKQVDGKKHWEHRGDPEAVRAANLTPALEAANSVIEEAQPNQPIHITNVLPYIQELDNPPGHSLQAVLFVDRAIILATELVSRAKLTG